MKTEIDSAVKETLLYHEQTKHHFHRYARSLGFLDWATQSLYHFTVGGPREDARLATRAAYHHLESPTP